jgi:hypothetical protein
MFFISTNKSISKQDNFKPIYFPYNPIIPTPQSNYEDKVSKINSQQKYKSDLYVSLSPTPTIHCPELTNKTDCNNYGCNWFSTFCSSIYPTQL